MRKILIIEFNKTMFYFRLFMEHEELVPQQASWARAGSQTVPRWSLSSSFASVEKKASRRPGKLVMMTKSGMDDRKLSVMMPLLRCCQASQRNEWL